MREEQRERKSSLRALKPLLCTVMSDSVCRVNSPKPRDGGSTQHKHKPKGRKTRAKPLYSAHTHPQERDEGGSEGSRPVGNRLTAFSEGRDGCVL